MLDRSSAREKMEKYTHSLVSSGDVRTYFMKKISLLKGSLISDEEEMTEKIWKGLDPILMTLVDLPRGRDCLENLLPPIEIPSHAVVCKWSDKSTHH